MRRLRRRPAATRNSSADTLRERGSAFVLILGILLLLLGSGVAACGGNDQTASPRTSGQAKKHPTTGGDQTSDEQGSARDEQRDDQQESDEQSPDEQTEPDDEDLGNAAFRKKLEDGDCSVKDDTEAVIAQTSDPAQRAEAHLYHALATAVCGGPEAAAAAELDAVRAQADLLSPESRATLDQVGANVPTSVLELRAVLAPAEGNP